MRGSHSQVQVPAAHTTAHPLAHLPNTSIQVSPASVAVALTMTHHTRLPARLGGAEPSRSLAWNASAVGRCLLAHRRRRSMTMKNYLLQLNVATHAHEESNSSHYWRCALNATPVNAPTQEEHPSMATKTNNGESNNSDPDQPKKRHWYNIRRNRRHSEGDRLDSGVSEAEPEGSLSPKDSGKSFVVIGHGSLNHHNPILIHTFTRLDTQWTKLEQDLLHKQNL